MKRLSIIYVTVIIIIALGQGGVSQAEASPDHPIPDWNQSEPFDSVPFTYAQLTQDNVPVYASPQDATLGQRPLRRLGGSLLWLSLDKQPSYVDYNGETWVMINQGEYVRADALSITQPSRLRGILLGEQPAFPLGWILEPVRPSQTPGGPPSPDVPELKRYDRVIIYEAQRLEDDNWYRIGPDQWVSQKLIRKVQIVPRPRNVGGDEKWVDVNLSEQTLAAYEGDRLVYATLVSTGLSPFYTLEGLTRIWAKVRTATLSGLAGTPDYYLLEDVPWIMYYSRNSVLGLNIAMHGAYWHDEFGYRYSHGCVNLSPRDAEWLFNWTTPTIGGQQRQAWATVRDPGTWVWVHK